MGFFSNLLGTLSSSFKIGKGGITITQGSSAPTGGKNGDIHVRSGDQAELYMKKANEWIVLGSDQGPSAPLSHVTSMIGDDVKTQFTIPHPFATRAVTVTIYENFGDYRDVMVAVSRPDINSIVLSCDDPIPTGLEYIVKITP